MMIIHYYSQSPLASLSLSQLLHCFHIHPLLLIFGLVGVSASVEISILFVRFAFSGYRVGMVRSRGHQSDVGGRFICEESITVKA